MKETITLIFLILAILVMGVVWYKEYKKYHPAHPYVFQEEYTTEEGKKGTACVAFFPKGIHSDGNKLKEIEKELESCEDKPIRIQGE